MSTCPEILDKLPPGKRAEKTSVSLEINASIERALGVVWCLESDCLTFRIELKDTPFHEEEFCHLLAQYLIHWGLQVLSCYRVSEYYRLSQVKKGMGWTTKWITNKSAGKVEKWNYEIGFNKVIKIL